MSTSTRAATSRQATTRRPIGGEPRLRLNVDLTGLPSDMEARWVTASVLGQAQDDNVQAALMDGWQPVTTEMLPNANPPLLPGRADESGGIVRRFGSILMMRRRADCDADRERLREADEEAKNAAVRLSVNRAEDGGEGFDGRNFVEDANNKIVERTTAGTNKRSGGKGDRFADA